MGLFYPPDSTGENKANAPASGNAGATYNAVTLLFSFCESIYNLIFSPAFIGFG